MKNKFLSFALSILLVLPCMFLLSACKDDQKRINVTTEEELISSINNAQDKTTIVLSNDIVITDEISITKNIVLDLNGHTISNTEDIWNNQEGKFALITVEDNGNLTVKGNGTLIAKENDCFAINIVNGNCTIENSTFIGNITAVQVQTGNLTINDGTFKIQQLATNVETDQYRYTLNCIDQYYDNDTANIIVNGGKFYNFNPENNLAEGENTNFAANNIDFVLEQDYYVVNK